MVRSRAVPSLGRPPRSRAVLGALSFEPPAFAVETLPPDDEPEEEELDEPSDRGTAVPDEVDPGGAVLVYDDKLQRILRFK